MATELHRPEPERPVMEVAVTVVMLLGTAALLAWLVVELISTGEPPCEGAPPGECE